MFNDKDLVQIKGHGLATDQVERQIADFRTGFPFLPIVEAAVIGEGIELLSDAQVEGYGKRYDEEAARMDVVKFVPASGAATRMFKDLFEFLSGGGRNKVVDQTLDRLDDFAFAHDLYKHLGGERDPQQVIHAIVKAPGLNYGALPKALIQFHKYDEGPRTAAEEHLAEGAMYARSGLKGDKVKLHFTVSGEHLDGFKKLFEKKLPKFVRCFGVEYEISFSQQKPSTDTIAVNEDNTPFREADGSLLFRPAGHGALLQNLNDIAADIIFVKNIDNVTTDCQKAPTVRYKKALAGLLVERQEVVFNFLARLDERADEELLTETAEYIESSLSYRLPAGFAGWPAADRRDYLVNVLDRPMRVCGVVRNEGEPGGGPFWAKNPDGLMQLQIAESSQIAPADMELMRSATHFNPVDLVCAVKDWTGEKFDLTGFTDPATGFISEKSKDGRKLRAQELPGLWNGAMARWTTIFVEVPIETFSPVKVVTDLLRPQHQ
ncbi:MAG: DUF4301 family protein [Rikenellaceae bacterium]|jgi:hypothetical protein|nr:DUF4301 family protein [Rikenellaceae bacterium]